MSKDIPVQRGRIKFLEAGKRRLAGDTARAATSSEVRDLRRKARELKEVVAEHALELRLLKKKHDRGWGKRGMRYPASEKLEIIQLVEQSHLPKRWKRVQLLLKACGQLKPTRGS